VTAIVCLRKGEWLLLSVWERGSDCYCLFERGGVTAIVCLRKGE